MDASSTSSSRVARAANAYRAPAAAALTRPGGSSAFAAAAVLGGNHRIVGVGAPSTCFAAAAHPAHPAAFSAASADEGQGLMSRMYAPCEVAAKLGRAPEQPTRHGHGGAPFRVLVRVPLTISSATQSPFGDLFPPNAYYFGLTDSILRKIHEEVHCFTMGIKYEIRK